MTRNRSFLRRLIVIAAVLAVVISVVGFIVAPPILKAQLVKRLSVELDRPVRIESVRLNPWVLSLTLEGVSIADRDGGAFVAWNRVYVNFDAASFFVREWRFQEITAVSPSSRVIVNKDSSLNFSDLIAKFGARPPSPNQKPAWPLRIAKLVVLGAQLDFADHSRSQEFATRLGPVNFSLVNFYTAPNRDAPYDFTAETEIGEKLRWRGTVSVNPLASEGELVISGIQPAKYAPYFRDRVRFDLLGGSLDMSGRYKVAVGAFESVALLSDGRVHLTNFQLAARGATKPALALTDIEVTGIQVDAAAQSAAIAKIAILGGNVAATRDEGGKINLLAMLEPVPAPNAAAAPPATNAAKPKPKVEIGAFSLRQFSARFEDRATPRLAINTIENAEVDLQKITLAEGALMPLHAALTLPNHGALNVDGTVGLFPVQATVTIDASNVSLATISPYVEPLLNVHITEGTVSTKGQARVALPANHAPEVAYQGDLAVDHFGLVDGVGNEALAGWSQLEVTGIDVKGMPMAVEIKEIAWTDPTAHVIVNRDHSLNLVAMLKPAVAEAQPKTDTPVATPSATPSPAATPLPKIAIGKVTVNNGAFTFADRSVQPEVSTAITKFGGTITGLSSENLARADVDLKATVDGTGPVAITGKLDPLSEKKSVDLRLDFKDVELTPFSPYSAKFAGFELARGKLFLDVNAKVADQKVDMSNVVTLTHFTFGAPSESPDATKLPVRLAVALLKDMDGKITIDVPVQGSLDDPEFRIGRVVMRVIGNLLTKVAVSPFSLLGAMFGGGGDELAYQDFNAGEAELTPDNLKKLETLTKALNARPALNLEIDGSFDPAADGYALKQRRFAQMLRSRLWEERRALDANTPPPEQLVVTPVDELALVQRLFLEKFPEGTAQAAPPPTVAPKPMAAPKPPPEKKSLFKRATDVVTLKSWRDRRSEKKEAEAAAAPAPAMPQPSSPAVFSGPSLDEMKARLADTIEVTNDDFRRLAAARAQRVRDYFIEHQIAGERLFLANVADQGKGPRVFLQLQ